MYTEFRREMAHSIEERFSVDNLEILESSSIFATANDDSSCLRVIASHLDTDVEIIHDEYHGIKSLIQTVQKKYPDNVLSQLAKVLHDETGCDNIKQMLSTYLVVPQSTADCERGFSVLKLIKTHLRNRLCSANLNNAMLIGIEGPTITEMDFDQAINLFSTKKRRVLGL